MEEEPEADRLTAVILRLERGDCVGAFAAFDELDQRGTLPPRGQEALARAAWLCGDIDRCVVAYEHAYRGYLDEANPRRAGFVALMLCWEHEGLLASARAKGWR